MMIRNRVHKVDGTNFTVPRQYTDLVTVGKGAFGVVASAMDILTHQKVAIKKISHATKAEQEAKHALREIRLMRYLGVHDNIMTLKGLSMREKSDELYIVMEYADTDLHRVIQSKQLLTEEHRQYFIFQILRAVEFIHKHNVIHRDLKPGNILVLRNCRILLSDFGLARERPTRGGIEYIVSDESDASDGSMTQHVVTRWYRAPELMLVPDGMYDSSIDMWSVGCILAELLGRKTLFPGKNFIDQLTLILNGIGSPLPQQIVHIKSKTALKFLDSVSGREKIDFCCMFPGCDQRETDLLEELLLFDPSQRLSARSALNHPYLQQTAHNMGPKSKDVEVKLDCDFQFESQSLGKEGLKLLVREEVKRINEIRETFNDVTVCKPKGKRGGTAAGTKRAVLSLSDDDGTGKRKPPRTRTTSLQRGCSVKDNSQIDKKDCIMSSKQAKKKVICVLTKDLKQMKQTQLASQTVMNYKTIPRSPKFSVMSWQKKANGTIQNQTGQ